MTLLSLQPPSCVLETGHFTGLVKLGCLASAPRDSLLFFNHHPNVEITNRWHCLQFFYSSSGDRTHILVHACQILYLLSHLPHHKVQILRQKMAHATCCSYHVLSRASSTCMVHPAADAGLDHCTEAELSVFSTIKLLFFGFICHWLFWGSPSCVIFKLNC